MPKTGFPTASKLLNKYEKERAYKQHQQKMQEMRHGLDNTNTRQYPHLAVSMKRLQKEEERQMLVDHENEMLVNKMRRIMTRKGRLDNWNADYQPKSLHTPYRERQQEQIAVQNIGIAKRLEKVGPVYHVKDWEEDFHRHEYILEKRAEETKEYEENITPRRQKTRASKTRQQQKVKKKESTAEDKYEDDFESEEDEDSKTENKNVGDSTSNHSNQVGENKIENQVENEKVQNDEKDSKLPKIDSNGKDGESSKEKDGRSTSKSSPRQSQVSKLPAVSQSKKESNKEDKLSVYKDKKYEEKLRQKNKQKKALANNSKSSKSSTVKQNDTKAVDEKRRKSTVSHNGGSVTTESSSSRGENSENPTTEDPETGEFSEVNSKDKADGVENQLEEQREEREISDQKNETETAKRSLKTDTVNQQSQEEGNSGPEGSMSRKQEMSNNDGTTLQQTTTTQKNDSAENQQSEQKTDAVRDSSPSVLSSAKSHHTDDIMSLYGQSEGGTTLADSDAKQLFRVCKELDKPDDVFIKTLVKRNHNQRMQTKAKFRDLYDLELISELRNSLGEDWHALINSMLTDREASDASTVHNALQSGDISSIIEVLCTRNTTSLNNLKEAYRKEYAISLESDFSEKTEDPVQLLLLSLLKGGRSESSEVDEDEAEKEARELYESGEGRWTSDTGKFIRLIEQKNTAQFRATLNVFKQISGGKDIMVSIREDCSGQEEYIEALSTFINCSKGPQMYFSEKLHGCKNLSEPSFVSVLVSRAEVDMPGTKKMYKKKYGKELADNLSNKGPHPTLKVLLELVNRPAPGQSKTKAQSTKKTTSTQPAPQPKKQATKKPEKKEEPSAPKSNPLDRPGKRVLHEAKHKREVEERSKTKQPTQKREKTKVEKEESTQESDNGTVKPSKDFDTDKDAERLYKAMDGLGTNEEEIMNILPQRSNSQRQQIKNSYSKKYDRDLVEDLKSELSGDFEELIIALMMEPIVYDAYCIHDAVKGLGTDEAALAAILSTRTTQEIKAIKEQYQNVYKSDLETDVSGDKSNVFKKMLVQLVKNQRKEGNEVDDKQAEDDAKKLYKEDPKSLSVADDILMNLLTLENKVQIQATFSKYKEVAGHDVIEGIKLAMLGEDEEGYIGLVKACEDVVEFHATHLKHSMMRDVGTDDKMVIRIIVSRSEIDLDKIKSKYAELYGQSLSEAVESESGGDFKKTLLVILGDK